MAQRKSSKSAKGGKAPAKRKRKRRSNGADGPLIGFIGRTLRTLAHWTAVAAIVCIGLVGAVTAYYASRLPPMAEWSVPQRPANVRILAANGALISNRGDSAGEALTLDEMPDYLPQAVIAIEDRRFYWNFGIDPIGLARAALANLRAGRVVEGGSTLTQQLAKNLFLTPERTFERKVQEVIMAMWLQMRLSKKQILTLYLNRVYLGGGAYGVDAAARRYFGKSARDVTLAEAATLAGMLKAPSHYSPATHPAAAEARMQTVLAAMQDAGYISGRQASLAMSNQVTAVHDVAGGSGRYVADWVMDTLPNYIGSIEPGRGGRHHHRLAHAGGGRQGGFGHARRGRRQIRHRPGGAGGDRPRRRGEGDDRRTRTTGRARSTAPSTRTASRARRSNRSST